MIKLNIKVKTRRRLTYSDVEFFLFCDSFKIVSSNSNIKSISLNAVSTTLIFFSFSNDEENKPSLKLIIRSEFQFS